MKDVEQILPSCPGRSSRQYYPWESISQTSRDSSANHTAKTLKLSPYTTRVYSIFRFSFQIMLIAIQAVALQRWIFAKASRVFLREPFVTLKNLSSKPQRDDDFENHLQGLLFIVEDLTSDIVELMDSELNIDPVFFAMHLHVNEKNKLSHQTPSEATLLTRFWDQNYFNTSYHRSAVTDGTHTRWARYWRNTMFIGHRSRSLRSHLIVIVRIW